MFRRVIARPGVRVSMEQGPVGALSFKSIPRHPVEEPVSGPRSTEAETPALKSVVTAVSTAQVLFQSASRQPQPTVKCLVFSWYGYSSLKIFEAQPRVCLNKVFYCLMGRVIGGVF